MFPLDLSTNHTPISPFKTTFIQFQITLVLKSKKAIDLSIVFLN